MVTMHCCELMDQFLDDPKVPLEYCRIFREYGIRLKGSLEVQKLIHCLWCGKTLPDSVRDKYLNILKKEYRVNPILNRNDPRIPQERSSLERYYFHLAQCADCYLW